MLIVPAGGLSPSIFEVMYWLAVVDRFTCSPDSFSRIKVKYMRYLLVFSGGVWYNKKSEKIIIFLIVCTNFYERRILSVILQIKIAI